MRVAIFSDVHGNLIALERFLQSTKGDVDAYICLGDVVNYGPWNDECLNRIRELSNITFLEGNHERLFLGIDDIEKELPLVKSFFFHSREFFSHPELIKDLLPAFDTSLFRCTHTIDERSIYPDTAIRIDRNYIIGHTHHQFRIERSGFTIVNPGSVGQNRKWIDMVDYAILDTVSGKVSLCSVDYDFSKMISELRARRYPKPCIEYYVTKAKKNTIYRLK